MPRTNANRPVRRRKVVAHYSDANPSTYTNKRQKKNCSDQDSPPPSSSSPTTPSALNRKKDPPLSSRKRKAPPTSPPPPPPCLQADDVSMAHPSIIQPVFPIRELIGTNNPSLLVSNNSIAAAHQHSVLLGSSGTTSIPPAPTWRSMMRTSSHHETEYDPMGTITWLSTRVDDESYAIVGDCRGAVGLLHNTGGGGGLVATIKVIRTTRAAQRDAQRREIKKKKIMAYPNAIVQCAWSHNIIVLLTKMELECILADSGDCLWAVPVEAAGDQRKNMVQQSPALSLRRNGLLWSTGQWGLPSISSSSLLLWDNVRRQCNDVDNDNNNNNNKPIVLSLGDSPNMRCLVALWEKTPETSRSFFCVCHTTDETTELIRGNVEESATCKEKTLILVEARQSLPTNGRIILSECTLQQFEQYLFVSGRGIRMYNAADLTFIATYGETVQLHGKVVFWSRCCWLPAPNIHDREIRISKKNCWIERADALSASNKNNKNNKKDSAEQNEDYWLISVPHPFKGPEELQSNIYVWRRQGGESAFFKAPPKGCVSDVWVNRWTWSTVVVSAANGDLKQLSDSMKTNFPGVMYPVGFNIASDNIEYIEDEDELDEVLADYEEPMMGLYDEDPVIAEDESSVCKDPSPETPLYIDVLANDDGDNQREDEFPVICWPEPRRCNDDDSDPGSPKHSDRRRNNLLPQLEDVKQEMVDAKQEEADVKPKPVPGKRRATNLENIKQSSIDARLRTVMQRRRFQWQDSIGSSLDTSGAKHSLEEKSLAMELLFLGPGQKRRHTEEDDKDILDDAKDELSCPACLGRMTLHTCGKREQPIDYDALAREEHAQHEREEAEKMRVKAERRKLAELKRREKKQKKLEEERLQSTQQQQAESEMPMNVTRPQSDGYPRMDVVHADYTYLPSPSLHCRDFLAFPPTLRIDGNEVVPSTSLDPTDALSALAGLADSLSNHETPGLSGEYFNSSYIANDGRHHGFGEGSYAGENLSLTEIRNMSSPLLLPSCNNFFPVTSSLDNGTTNEPANDLVPSATNPLPYGDSDHSGDIVFHTSPGSATPILESPAYGVTNEQTFSHHDKFVNDTSYPLHQTTSSALLPSVNGSSSNLLSPSGLSAIAMLSETAAQQAIIYGKQDELMTTDHVQYVEDPRIGTSEMPDDGSSAPNHNHCTEIQTSGPLRLDSFETGTQA